MKSFKDYIREQPTRGVFAISLSNDEYQNIADDIKMLKKDELLRLKEVLKEATDYINSHPELLI